MEIHEEVPMAEPSNIQNKYTSVFAEITKNVLGDDSCFNHSSSSEEEEITPKSHFRSFKPDSSTSQTVANYKYEA